MRNEDLEIANELFDMIMGNQTKQHLTSCEKALVEKDRAIEIISKELVEKEAELAAQSDYIEDLEDENYEISNENKELRELLDLERNKNEVTETFELEIGVSECYDTLISVYNILKVVDGLNKAEVEKLKNLVEKCIDKGE